VQCSVELAIAASPRRGYPPPPMFGPTLGGLSLLDLCSSYQGSVSSPFARDRSLLSFRDTHAGPAMKRPIGTTSRSRVSCQCYAGTRVRSTPGRR
jgi:hypothetical protein